MTMVQEKMTNDSEDARARFVEACEMARHYGNMRFAFATFFTAILGALMTVEFKYADVLLEAGLLHRFRVWSAVLAGAFAIGEWRLGMLISTYQQQASKYPGQLQLGLPWAHAWFRIIIPLVVSAPVLLALGYWIWCLRSGAGTPLFAGRG